MTIYIRFAPGLRPVLKHEDHNQKDHAGKRGRTLRLQGDQPINPETEWVHEETWYHGTSRPDLVTLDARKGPSRYPGMGSTYSLMAYNFATNDKELAAQYARDALAMDEERGITGGRAVVYEVKPTSDYFDPDPHSGPGGWNDGPEDMTVAREIVDGGGSVSLRFHDQMDIVGAFDAESGEPMTVEKSLMLKHGDPSRPGYAQQHPNSPVAHTGREGPARPGEEFGEWGDRAAEIRAAAGNGPSIDDMQNVAAFFEDEDGARERIENDLRLELENDRGVYEIAEQRANDDFDYLVAIGDEQNTPEARKAYLEDNIDQVQEQVINDMLPDMVDERFQQESEDMSTSLDMGGVFDMTHTAVTLDPASVEAIGLEFDDMVRRGEAVDNPESRQRYLDENIDRAEVTMELRSEVSYTEVTYDGEIVVRGEIYSDSGRMAGEFERKFYIDTENGGMSVSHELLTLDPEYQGTGFAAAFNRNAENYYIATGLQEITVHAALEVGGYAWAKQGFDFRDAGNVPSRLAFYDDSRLPADVRAAKADIDYRFGSRPVGSPGYPTPGEVAALGYVPGAKTWPGKEILVGSNWYGRKPLTPDGRRIGNTEPAQAQAAEARAEEAAAARPVPGQKELPFGKRLLVRSAPGLRPLLKHGDHNQKDHAGKSGGSEMLPEGWSRETEGEVTTYGGPNESSVIIVGISPNPATMNTVLSTISRLQQQNPVKGLVVRFDEEPWREFDIPDEVKAFVVQGGKTINIKPDYATGQKLMEVEQGFFMPAAQGKDQLEYVITHEYGHVLDRRSPARVSADRYEMYLNGAEKSLSQYGSSNQYEAYAEAYAEFSLTGGKTANPASLYFSQKYRWGENLSKAISEEAVSGIIILDTFDPLIPPTTRAAVLKHGDPSRPGYAAQHPNSPVAHTGREGAARPGEEFGEWGDRAAEIRAAKGNGPSAEELVSFIDKSSFDEDQFLAEEEEKIRRDLENDLDFEQEVFAEADRRFDALVAQGLEEDTEESRDEFLYQKSDQIKKEMIEERVFASDAPYEALERKRAEATVDPGAFDPVFELVHSGVTPDGRTVTLSAVVTDTVQETNSIESYITVSGAIFNEKGVPVGDFQRTFGRDDDGIMTVSHDSLRLRYDVQGTGFAAAFNRNAENYYIAAGVEQVTVHAALDVGGYAWAKQGFDFDGGPGTVHPRFANMDTSRLPDELRRIHSDIVDRFISESPGRPNYPTPGEIASFGYIPGAKTWPGKEALLGSDWFGRKVLTPDGRRIGATESRQAAIAEEASAATKSIVVRFAPGLRPVLKHGNHNQKDHGRRGGGDADFPAPTGYPTDDGPLAWPVPAELQSALDKYREDDDSDALEDAIADYIEETGAGDDVSDALRRRIYSMEEQDDAWEEASDQEKARTLATVDEVRQEGDVCVAVPSDVVIRILDDGRIRSQFETGRSGGLLNNDIRASGEAAVQGVPLDLPPQERPIYGYVTDRAGVMATGVDQYGDVRIVLKSSVKERSTMTVGDSLNTRAFPVPMTGPITERQAFNAVDRAGFSAAYRIGRSDYDRDDLNRYSYFEAQVRGGISLSDIAAIHVSGFYTDTDTVLTLKRATSLVGIPLVVEA